MGEEKVKKENAKAQQMNESKKKKVSKQDAEVVKKRINIQKIEQMQEQTEKTKRQVKRKVDSTPLSSSKTKEAKKAIIPEALEKEIEEKKKLPKEKIIEINTKIFQNIMLAITIMLFLLFINLGYRNIGKEAYITDLKVFSISLIIITIILFEKAYKKDSGQWAIHGIEVFVLSVLTLSFPFIVSTLPEQFMLIVGCISFLFGIYYVGKSIIINIKEKRSYFKNNSDIKQITKNK